LILLASYSEKEVGSKEEEWRGETPFVTRSQAVLGNAYVSQAVLGIGPFPRLTDPKGLEWGL
jgi:hypothetical protein